MRKSLHAQLRAILRSFDDPYERLSAVVIGQAFLDGDWKWLYSDDTSLWVRYLDQDPQAFKDHLARWRCRRET